MLLAQILIRAPGPEPVPALPPVVAQNTRSLVAVHPAWPHRIFLHDEIRDILKERFSPEVSHAFAALKPYAYQADLARYCLLYESGGIYADLSYFFTQPLPVGEGKIVVFRDFLWSSPWDTSNGVFYAPPRHPALALAIELVCANVRRAYYGATALCPTGPALFGKALASTCEAEDLIAGSALLLPRARLQESQPDLPLPEGPAIHCLVLREQLIAIKRKPLGSPGLEGLGITDGNAYGTLWKNRDVYAPSMSRPE